MLLAQKCNAGSFFISIENAWNKSLKFESSQSQKLRINWSFLELVFQKLINGLVLIFFFNFYTFSLNMDVVDDVNVGFVVNLDSSFYDLIAKGTEMLTNSQ